MVGPFGEVLVMDWGIAQVGAGGALGTGRPGALDSRCGPGARLTAAGTVLGTPGAMAPEQERGEELDERADVFALGALLRLLLAGVSRPDRRLSAIVEKATAPEREARYRDVPSLAADVARFLDGERVTAYRERPWEVAWRFAVRHRVALLLLLAYLAARALVFAVTRR